MVRIDILALLKTNKIVFKIVPSSEPLPLFSYQPILYLPFPRIISIASSVSFQIFFLSTYLFIYHLSIDYIWVCTYKYVQKIYACIHLCVCIIFREQGQVTCIIPEFSFHVKICHGDQPLSVHVVLSDHCIIFHNMDVTHLIIILLVLIRLFPVTY